MKTFTQNQINEIINQYNNTADVEAIVAFYGCEQRDIRLILKEYQVDRQYNTFTDELTQRVINMHLGGQLHKEIRYQLLVSNTGINKILDRNHISRMSYTDRNRRFNRNSYYFDEINTEEKAYYLGLLSSDGCNFTLHKQITFSLQEEDKYLVEGLKNALEYEGAIRCDDRAQRHNPNCKIQYRLVIQDIHLSERLEELGIVQTKSLIYEMPNNIPQNLLRHFIRGYFDGNGTVYYDVKRQKGISSVVSTFDFCSKLQQILYDMDIKSNIRNPKQSKGKNTYVLRTAGTKSSYYFLSWIYDEATVKMERKYQKYLQIKERYFELHDV